MDNALTEASIEGTVINTARTAEGLRLRTSMKKDQVEVRFIAQFNATQLAVAQHNKARRLLSAALRLAILAAEMLPSNGHRMFNHHLGNPGEIVTDLHQRKSLR